MKKCLLFLLSAVMASFIFVIISLAGVYSSCIVQHVTGQADYSADWCYHTGSITYYLYIIS